MNLDKGTSTVTLKEQTKKKVSNELLYPLENPVNVVVSEKFKRYKNIFVCKYTAIKD